VGASGGNGSAQPWAWEPLRSLLSRGCGERPAAPGMGGAERLEYRRTASKLEDWFQHDPEALEVIRSREQVE
jgi:hypothetical protein